ncbi:MAG: AGE family epimerase/isomerase [Vallitaleaceae bacterium]|nr:AGE family epimerase/isomerase [Vallitaleaceae bacterium]
MNKIETMRLEIMSEVENHILPFWMNLKDNEFGGFYGKVDYDLLIDQKANKGGIATARLLWTFSSAYRVLGKDDYLDAANHVYDFFVKHILDDVYKGVLWMVDYKGQSVDDRKHIYAQAFGIYGLSEYYRATKNSEALELAISLYRIIEDQGYDKVYNIYKEEFTNQWVESNNEMLSENGIIAEATTNTHLHILEAYTNLYRVWPDEQLRTTLINLVDLFCNKIYKKETKFMKVFYNKNLEEIIDMQSYGHDIEASWLLDEAIKVLKIEKPNYLDFVKSIAKNINEVAFNPDGSLMNERVDGQNDCTKVWWVQVEAMVGFYNAYERTGKTTYIESVLKLWNYVGAYMIDERRDGEWVSGLDQNNIPIKKPIVEPWKTPYHNARFCLEMIERI